VASSCILFVCHPSPFAAIDSSSETPTRGGKELCPFPFCVILFPSFFQFLFPITLLLDAAGPSASVEVRPFPPPFSSCCLLLLSFFPSSLPSPYCICFFLFLASRRIEWP
jgi:hypothetical protein